MSGPDSRDALKYELRDDMLWEMVRSDERGASWRPVANVRDLLARLTAQETQIQQIVEYAKHKHDCMMLKTAPYCRVVQGGILAIDEAERQAWTAARVCDCGLSALLVSDPHQSEQKTKWV